MSLDVSDRGPGGAAGGASGVSGVGRLDVDSLPWFGSSESAGEMLSLVQETVAVLYPDSLIEQAPPFL